MRALAADRLVLVGSVTLPLAAGLGAVLLPAFGYFPALGGEHLSLAPLSEALALPGLTRSAGLSLFVSLTATVLALGAVMLALAAFAGAPALGRLARMLSPLLSVPHAATAFGLAFLVAPSGLVMRVLSPELTGLIQPPDWPLPKDPFGLTLVAGLVVKEIPFLFLVALAALPLLPLARSRQLAEGLGYGRVAAFAFFVAPLLYRRIRLPVLAVLVYAGSAVDMALILGPDLPPLLSVRVLRLMADPDLGRLFTAAAAALLQLVVTGAALLAWFGLERLAGALLSAARTSGRRFAADRPLLRLAPVLPLASALVIGMGLATLALWSVASSWRFPDAWPTRLDASLWLRLAPRLLVPLANSLALALLASLIALCLTLVVLVARERRGVDRGLPALLFLPLMVPDLVFLFGLQLATIRLGLPPGLPAVLAGHLVFVLPYVALSLEGPWRAYDRRYDRLAASLGKSPLRILLTVRLRILARPLMTALAVGFAVSAGLYLPTLLLGGGRIETVTTDAVSLAAGGDRRLIGAYGLLQAVLPFAGFSIAALVSGLLWQRAGRRPNRA